jgi:hypothetical protein
LPFIAHNQTKMTHAIGLYLLHFKHRQELVVPEFEESVALASIEFLEVKDILVECRCLLDVIHLDDGVIAAIHLDAHELAFHYASKALPAPA